MMSSDEENGVVDEHGLGNVSSRVVSATCQMLGKGRADDKWHGISRILAYATDF
jgi:biotin-(acetyl-CoA carboxylase) ligase